MSTDHKELSRKQNRLYDATQNAGFSMSVMSRRPDHYNEQQFNEVVELYRQLTEERIENFRRIYEAHKGALALEGEG